MASDAETPKADAAPAVASPPAVAALGGAAGGDAAGGDAAGGDAVGGDAGQVDLPRYDILIATENPALKIAPRGSEAFLRYLAVARMISPDDESVAENWVEVYCAAGASAHEVFMIGVAPSDGVAMYHRAVVRFGLDLAPLPFGDERQSNFWILFEGARFEDVQGGLKAKFKDILNARPTVFVRPHAGISPKREVAEDQKPKVKVNRERSTALAGTRVEEW